MRAKRIRSCNTERSTASSCQLLDTAMAEVSGHLTLMNTTLLDLNKKMDGLDHIIRGNGTPGIAAKVDDLVQTRHRWRDAFFTAGGGLIVGLVLFLIQTLWSLHNANQNLPPMQQVTRSH